MRKIQLFLIATMLLCVTYNASAQITTATPTASVIKTGNRPQAGTWGVFMGLSVDEIKDIHSDNLTYEGVPLINFKYYTSDNVELRLGLLFSGTSTNIKGEITSTEYEEKETEGEDGEITTTEVEKTVFTDYQSYSLSGENKIIPGIAYHFGNRNLLDVYVGANIPIGWNRYKTIETIGDATCTTKSSPFTIGIGGFVGMQAFIADLPIAVGVEYGISANKELGTGKTKISTVDEDGNRETYYTYDGMPDTTFDKLKTASKVIKNEIRFTVSYYFN